jgi:hypothetical protein
MATIYLAVHLRRSVPLSGWLPKPGAQGTTLFLTTQSMHHEGPPAGLHSPHVGKAGKRWTLLLRLAMVWRKQGPAGNRVTHASP